MRKLTVLLFLGTLFFCYSCDSTDDEQVSKSVTDERINQFANEFNLEITNNIKEGTPKISIDELDKVREEFAIFNYPKTITEKELEELLKKKDKIRKKKYPWKQARFVTVSDAARDYYGDGRTSSFAFNITYVVEQDDKTFKIKTVTQHTTNLSGLHWALKWKQETSTVNIINGGESVVSIVKGTITAGVDLSTGIGILGTGNYIIISTYSSRSGSVETEVFRIVD